ncbi:MAG: hypothetical protein K940chlam2_01065 [Chlamydiae bacterium]|nr:hypothetical protein [Chlamydiota bacterium]
MHLFQLDVVAVAAALHAHKNAHKNAQSLNLNAHHQSANAHLRLAALKKGADAKKAALQAVAAHAAVKA